MWPRQLQAIARAAAAVASQCRTHSRQPCAAAAALLTPLSRASSTFTPTTCVPVAIVGGGPTGLVLSSLLSLYGVQHVLLERAAALTDHPQAHFINNRSMEVFRALGGDLAATVAARSPPLEQWRRFLYCEAMLGGEVLGEVDHFPGQAAPSNPAVSPEPVTHLSQHKLAALLLGRAVALGASRHAGAVEFSRQVTSVSMVEFPHEQQQQQQQQQQPDRPQAPAALPRQSRSQQDEEAHTYPLCVAVADTSHQQQQRHQVLRCSYLVAADGSHSTVRQLLGIPMDGQAGMQHLISIHFTWPALGVALLAGGRGGMLYFVFNARVVAVLVAHDLRAGEFVAQVPFFPPLQSPSQFTRDVCTQIIRDAAGFSPLQQQQQQQPWTGGAGPDGGGLQLHTVKSWVMSAEVAREYGAWGGRLLLAGDAAHRFPPAGGFGMNTGIQDAHNLAWKLAAVLGGAADPALLTSYQAERLPVAAANSALSVANWHEALHVPQALGLHPGAAAAVNGAVSAAPLPAPLAGWLLDAALAAGRGLAAAAVPLRRGALQDILASGQSLRLQFPREDLGFVYAAGAVAGAAADGTQQQPRSGQAPRSSVYEPCTVVGGRLPHCWLRLPAAGHSGGLQRVSTLDLVAPQQLGLRMLLLCSGGAAAATQEGGGGPWVTAGLQLQAAGWPLQVLRVLPQGTLLQKQAQPAGAALLAEDCDGGWTALHRGSDTVAVLVRPDGHIAWKQAEADGSSSSEAARRELQHILHDVMHLRVSGTAAATG